MVVDSQPVEREPTRLFHLDAHVPSLQMRIEQRLPIAGVVTAILTTRTSGNRGSASACLQPQSRFAPDLTVAIRFAVPGGNSGVPIREN